MAEKICVAVDAMGGDLAPEAQVRGAVQAVRQGHASVVLCGDLQILTAAVEAAGGQDLLEQGLRIVHASETVAMDEKAALAARKKKDSSIRVALDLVKKGEAQAMVSAGNSGAVMATALVALGRIKGVQRPAILSSTPNLKRRTALLDVGANIDVTPEILAQWAYIGEAYARLVEGCERPKVGVLSNGEEDAKGTVLTRGANAILKQSKGLNYAGYAEGRDVAGGDFDVIVTDGFTGNVVLKTLEGTGKFVSHFFRSEFEKGWLRKLGYALSKGVFDTMRQQSDYRHYGGAPLLGIQGVVIISHGGSDELAMLAAVKQARHQVQVGLIAAIASAVTNNQELFGSHRSSSEAAPATQ